MFKCDTERRFTYEAHTPPKDPVLRRSHELRFSSLPPVGLDLLRVATDQARLRDEPVLGEPRDVPILVERGDWRIQLSLSGVN